MLCNRYYLGIVSYRGVEYSGKHEPLVSPELFSRVQRILDEREQHAVKQRRHQHYLRGLMTCGRCGSRLMYTVVRGKAGGMFAYYVCTRRHRRDGCDLPYIAAHELEQRLERNWLLYIRLDLVDAEALSNRLREDLLGGEGDKQASIDRLTRRLVRLDSQRLKLVEMAYADAIPLDLLKSEQGRVAREVEQVKHELADAEHADGRAFDTYEQAQVLMRRGAEVYAVSEPDVRRQLNRAFIARLEIDADREHVTLGSPWREIRDAAVYLREQRRRMNGHRASWIYERSGSQTRSNPGLLIGQGSSMNPLVELRGLEPRTCCLQSSRSTT
jgi:site-specific DNA recombinase